MTNFWISVHLCRSRTQLSALFGSGFWSRSLGTINQRKCNKHFLDKKDALKAPPRSLLALYREHPALEDTIILHFYLYGGWVSIDRSVEAALPSTVRHLALGRYISRLQTIWDQNSARLLTRTCLSGIRIHTVADPGENWGLTFRDPPMKMW